MKQKNEVHVTHPIQIQVNGLAYRSILLNTESKAQLFILVSPIHSGSAPPSDKLNNSFIFTGNHDIKHRILTCNTHEWDTR
jgi:hypothetical protein